MNRYESFDRRPGKVYQIWKNGKSRVAFAAQPGMIIAVGESHRNSARVCH
jgi:hypothetical protein